MHGSSNAIVGCSQYLVTHRPLKALFVIWVALDCVWVARCSLASVSPALVPVPPHPRQSSAGLVPLFPNLPIPSHWTPAAGHWRHCAGILHGSPNLCGTCGRIVHRHCWAWAQWWTCRRSCRASCSRLCRSSGSVSHRDPKDHGGTTRPFRRRRPSHGRIWIRIRRWFRRSRNWHVHDAGCHR